MAHEADDPSARAGMSVKQDQLGSGDVTELFREHHLELVRLALVMVGDLATAEDFVQDAASIHVAGTVNLDGPPEVVCPSRMGSIEARSNKAPIIAKIPRAATQTQKPGRPSHRRDRLRVLGVHAACPAALSVMVV